MKTIEELITLNPCREGFDWAKSQPSLYEAWETCKRGDWMWWLLSKKGIAYEISVKFANFCSKNAAAYAAASYTSTTYAAYAADDAAYAAAAADDAAAYAAAAASAASTAVADAYCLEKEKQANFIRTLVSNPFEKP